MFSVVAQDGPARAGMLRTDHGDVPTPVFMPVGTQGTVKAMSQEDLVGLNAGLILGNTYHLYLRPGTQVLEQMGGLHKFMSWDRTILTDSGGYQVFSLSELRTIREDGVTFRSHLDGSSHVFTPEQVVEIQRVIGSDVMMVLDECAPFPSDREYADRSVELTTRWAQRSRSAFLQSRPRYGHQQWQFGIVQGSTYEDLRIRSARALVDLNFDGYAIGGLAVGESVDAMYHMVDTVAPILPADRPRYLMGVGTPQNLIEAVSRGVDMFDCVLPTRNGRNGQIFTAAGTLNLRNAIHRTDPRPLEERCPCITCRSYSRAYLRHLVMAKEVLALHLATVHNLTYYLELMRAMRSAILERRFDAWKNSTLAQLSSTEPV